MDSFPASAPDDVINKIREDPCFTFREPQSMSEVHAEKRLETVAAHRKKPTDGDIVGVGTWRLSRAERQPSSQSNDKLVLQCAFDVRTAVEWELNEEGGSSVSRAVD